jgi:hypothetical protein
MNIHAIVCTRSSDHRPTKAKLISYFKRCGIHLHLLEDQDSIFEAYSETVKSLDVEDTDIIILCHDDIQILLDPKVFVELLIRELNKVGTGFIGPAGTTLLTSDAVWWNHYVWKQGFHKGIVYHGTELDKLEQTYYGPPGQVVCLDGLFLAAKVRTLKQIKMDRPKEYEGKWDFYDIYYTTQAHKKGLTNRVAPIIVVHNSFGELAGRESWHKNREAFIQMNTLPMSCPNGKP